MKAILIRLVVIVGFIIVGSPSASAQVFFQDDFSDGVLVMPSAGEVGWRPSSSGGEDSVEVVPNSPNGTHALEFKYGGNLDITDDGWAEQRFDLGGQYPEIWVKYDLHVPLNYYHRYDINLILDNVVGVFNVGNQVQVVGTSEYARIHKISGDTIVIRDLTAGRFSFLNNRSIINTDTGATALISNRIGMPDNNKGLLQMWSGGYGTANTTQYLGFENWIDRSGNSLASYHPVVDMGRYRPGHTLTGALFVDREKDLGEWVEWIMQLKVASSANNDGIVRVWKNGVLVVDVTDLPNYSPLGNNYYEKGYLLGWSNSGFDETTTMYIDNVVFSTTSLVLSAGTTAPIITLLGSPTVSIALGSTYNDAGATAEDNIDGTITSSIVTVNPINTALAGTYTVTYNVENAAGNAAAEVTRTVTVAVDTTINYDDYLETDFKLFWHNPVRAHPDVPLDFHYSVYEKNNQALTWELVTAPDGMSISQNGEVDWLATTQDAGKHSIQLKVTRADGDFIERDFTLTVGTDDFLFVSTSGDDSNSGTIDSPYRTMEHAMRQTQNGVGKTIYVQGGTYQEVYNWEINGVYSPWRNKHFSPESPTVFRSYPNEQAILDANFQGHGFWPLSTSSYVVHSNLEVINAGAGERAGLLLSGVNNIAKDITVRNSQWDFSNNVTGFQIRGRSNLLDRAIGSDNKDPNSPHWNSSNYLVYASGGTPGEYLYVMNSVSTGSVTGFKIKHAGQKRVIFHNNLSYDDATGFAMASNLSSIRHSVVIRPEGKGIGLYQTDPNAYTSGKMLVEQNTIINPGSEGIFNPDGTYLSGGTVIRNNIIYSDIADTRFLMLLRPSIDVDSNLLYALNQNDVVRIGGETWHPGTNYDFSVWQVESPNSVFGDPLFENLANNNVRVPLDSPANFGNGEFAGAFKPTTSELSSVQYTLTTTTSGNGNISPADGSFNDGTVVGLTATPDTGWRFDGWSGDLSGTASPQDLTMDADRTVTAMFSSIEFSNTISITPNPTQGTFSIEMEGEVLASVIVYNELGQRIKTSISNEVDISNVASGIYFVKIISQNGLIAVKKIIKN